MDYLRVTTAKCFYYDVHCLKLELPPEHAATHDPVIDHERCRLDRIGTKNDGTDDTVVAKSVG